MEQDKTFEKDFAEMWQNLNPEQKALILKHQQSQADKAVLKAKKDTARRALDKQDRDKLFFALEEAGCKLYVSRVESTANNGWQTPTGLTVGMKEEEIEKRMGKSYRDNNAYTYNLGSFRLAFYPKDGVISKIVLVSHDVHRD